MPSSSRTFEQWNRRIHFYLGLYFVFFLWLFSLTGLMLNHGQWLVSLAANERSEERYDRPIELPPDATPLARARDVMRQLGIVGEVDITPQRPGFFNFNTSRPGDANVINVDLEQGRAAVRHFDNNLLARFRILHTFSGSRYNQPASERDWILTTVWVLAMDALAAGLIVMVLGSYYMWWRLKRRHGLGLFVLAAGVVTCGWFLPHALG
jgi:hypothetical protein